MKALLALAAALLLPSSGWGAPGRTAAARLGRPSLALPAPAGRLASRPLARLQALTLSAPIPSLLRARRAPLPDGTGAAPLGLRRLSEIEELRLGTYNVLNLFQTVGKWIPTNDPNRRAKIADAKAKSEEQLRGAAQAILESDLDVVVMQEVENLTALRQFSERYLGGKYRPLLIDGNDERKIDVGFLVKSDLPFDIEHRTHQDRTWVDPLGDGSRSRVFSRDLPALIVRAPGRRNPLFILLGTHYKSKRTRHPRDPLSEGLRRAQVVETAKIIAELRQEFGPEAPLMLAGDFNGSIGREPTFDPLLSAGFVDALDLAEPPLTPEQRVTHTYHPQDGPARKEQMDGFFLSGFIQTLVKTARVYRYKGKDGREKPLPETIEERSRNPSDHFPLLVTIRFQPLVGRTGSAPPVSLAR